MLKILRYVLKDINSLKPHELARDVTKIDYQKLRESGIKYLIYDKDNTLTLQDKFEFFNKDIEQTMIKVKALFGDQNVAILSNNKNPSVLEQCHEKLGIHHIPSLGRKPFNEDDVLKYFKLQRNELNKVCMIGDRLMTDIMLGNRSGMYTIYTYPLDETTDLFSVQPLRIFENLLIRYKFSKTK